MAGRDYRPFLSRFDLEYKKAFARQQGVSEQLIDTLTADGSAKGLDDYLNKNFNICHSYEVPRYLGKYKPFLHRENTYPKKCHKCDINTDYDYNIIYLERASVPPVTPRHAGEGDEPMTPQNYTRYDEILEEEQRKREEEQRRQEERQRMMEEEQRKREEEQRKREEEQRKREEEKTKREEKRIKNIPNIKEETLRQGDCPIILESVDEMVVSKLCGHGISKGGREGMLKQANKDPIMRGIMRGNVDNCPVCKQKKAFSEGNTETLYTSQGKEKRARIIELCKKGVLTAAACAAAAVAAPYFTGGKKTRRRNQNKKMTRKNKTKRARTKVKKDRKNKTRRK